MSVRLISRSPRSWLGRIGKFLSGRRSVNGSSPVLETGAATPWEFESLRPDQVLRARAVVNPQRGELPVSPGKLCGTSLAGIEVHDGWKRREILQRAARPTGTF